MSGDSNVVVHLPPSSSSGNGHAAMDRHLHSRYDKQGSKKSKSSNQKTREMIKVCAFHCCLPLSYVLRFLFLLLLLLSCIFFLTFSLSVVAVCMVRATVLLFEQLRGADE